MPAVSTVFSWIRLYEEFSKQYARATEERTEAMAEDILDIADDALTDSKEDVMEKGVNAVVQAHKLKLEARKWLMSKMKPKKYGDKLDVMSNGEAIQGNTIVIKNFSSDAPTDSTE